MTVNSTQADKHVMNFNDLELEAHFDNVSGFAGAAISCNECGSTSLHLKSLEDVERLINALNYIYSVHCSIEDGE